MNVEGSENMRPVMKVNKWSGPWIKDRHEVKNSYRRGSRVSKFEGKNEKE